MPTYDLTFTDSECKDLPPSLLELIKLNKSIDYVDSPVAPCLFICACNAPVYYLLREVKKLRYGVILGKCVTISPLL